MTDIATLKIEVKADGTAKVTGDLDKLTDSSKKADTQASKTSKTFLGMGSTFQKVAVGLGSLVGITSVTAALVGVTKQAIAFEDAMTEVSTLTNTMDMSELTQEVKALSAEFGSDKITQAKALYQVISAGASTAAEATEVLAVANKLAVGGVTDVATAADGLTSAINAYGLEASQALDVSDMMFTAMKAGKTTIGELSGNIGKLAPIAAQAGVGMDELFAATAAVTKTGLDTSMTMNSLRQAIAGILKPSSEASETAEELGLQFNAASLKSKGLVTTLQEVMTATKGNTETLTKLFGSVESLGAVMALTSESGARDFLEILGQMEQRSGATDEAFEKISQTTGFLATVLREQIKNEMLSLGTVILEKLNPALVYVTKNFDDLKETATLLGKVLYTGVLAKGLLYTGDLLLGLPALLTKGTGAFGLLTGAVHAFTAALLANPFGLVAVGVATAISALYVFRDETVSIQGHTATVTSYVAATWEYTASVITDLFESLGVNLKYIWNSLSEDVRRVLNTITKYVSTAVPKIGKLFYDEINTIIRGWDGLGKSIGIILASLVTPGESVGEALSNMWSEISGKDYVGEFIDNAKDVVEEIAKIAEESEKTNDALQEVVVTAKRWGEITPQVSMAREATVGFTGASLDLSDAIKIVDEDMKDLEKTTDKISTQLEGPFQEALQHTVQRIDEAFVDAWKGAYNSFNDFAHGIIDGFKELLAELAHMAITRPIVMNIGAAFGLGTGASAASAAGTGMNLATSLSSAWSALSAGPSSWISSNLQSLAGSFESMGFDAGAQFVTGYEGALAQAGNGSVALGGLYTAGAGLLGHYAANQIVGETTGVGSTVGTVAGTYFGGPIGAGIGAFLGAGVEKVLGDILGFGGKGENDAGRATFDLSTGSITAEGVGKKFDQDNVDAAQALATGLKLFSDTIGGSDFAGSIKVGNTSGIKLDGKSFETAEELFQYTFKLILDGATNLSDGLKQIISDFEGASDEILLFSESIIALSNMLEGNPIDEALADWDAAMQAANRTIMDSFKDQVGATADLVLAYDGSATSAADLAISMATTRDMAYQLAISIKQVGQALDAMLTSSAQQIRETMMTEQELFDYRLATRDRLIEELRNADSPDEIYRLADEINNLNNALFASLSEDERNRLTTSGELSLGGPQEVITVGEEYARVADEVLMIANDRLKASEESLRDMWDGISTGLDELLQRAAQTNQAAADEMAASVANFGGWVQALISQGITVKVEQVASEVNR